ncbi:hypothetical protein [Arenimonas sp.]|uniref:hypothetical protein n=1 Tax=Arenimonas sp. TaxID=1872635 RepID=UPI0035B05459
MRKALLVLALVALQPAFAADRIAGWDKGEAYIFSYDPAGPLRIGTVAADGTVELSLPAVQSTEQTLGTTFPSCLESGEPIVSERFASFTPTSLFVAADDYAMEELGSLHLVSSPEMLAWQASHGQGSATKGSWYQYVNVSQAATLEAECKMGMYTGEGDDNFEQTTVYAAQFKPDWNLMRNEVTELRAGPSGKQYPKSIRVTVSEGVPEDAQWLFQPLAD